METISKPKTPEEKIAELERGNTELCNTIQALNDMKEGVEKERDRYKVALIDILLACKGCPAWTRAYEALGEAAVNYYKYDEEAI